MSKHFHFVNYKAKLKLDANRKTYMVLPGVASDGY
jgi:hypothetical protein